MIANGIATHGKPQRELSEMASPLANIDLRKTEIDADYRQKVGRAFAEATQQFSLKELSVLLDRDERQIARWMNGVERPQFDVLFACELLRQPLVVALARLAGDAVEIETVVRVRRIA